MRVTSKLMRSTLIILATIWMCGGPAVAGDVKADYDPAAARQGRGAVALSMTMPLHDDMSHWGHANFSVWYTAVGRNWPQSLRLPGGLKDPKDSPSELPDVYGQLRVTELPVGEYELNNFYYWGYEENYQRNAMSNAGLMPRLRFRVQAGRVTYLGRIHMPEVTIAPGGSLLTSYIAWPQFQDAKDQDLALLATRYPRISSDRIDIAVPDPAAWTRAWLRPVACLGWRPAGFAAFSEALPDGVYPWQRSLREFALTLQTCNVGTPDSQSFSAIALERNLKGGEIAWEGVVTAISLANGAITLQLDGDISDVSVRVVTSYFKGPATTTVSCCLVYGQFDSWRDVKVGDRIRLEGNLDGAKPLTYGATPETAPTRPVTPVIMNARATILAP